MSNFPKIVELIPQNIIYDNIKREQNFTHFLTNWIKSGDSFNQKGLEQLLAAIQDFYLTYSLVSRKEIIYNTITARCNPEEVQYFYHKFKEILNAKKSQGLINEKYYLEILKSWENDATYKQQPEQSHSLNHSP